MENPARNVSGGQGSHNGAGNRGDGEKNARLVIDSFHASVRKRAGQCVEKNDSEGNRGDKLSRFLRVKQQEYGNQNKSATCADEGSKGTDQYSQREEPQILDGYVQAHIFLSTQIPRNSAAYRHLSI